ncbi:MAG: CapA family protein [Verrucomicrobiota bacterium]|jgi:poly-gamma-glutamate synthesis protein (capsule biosynthesis protein)
MTTVLIGADICPVEGNRSYFEKGDARNLFNNLLVEFERADLRIANLECPLIEKPTPILKTGPTFGEANACINGIKTAGINVLGLANNHILDHGSEGLKNTLEVCAKAGIATTGAGDNLRAARQILVTDVKGIRVGILAVAEHEFSTATKDSPGANPLDLMDYVRNVNSRRGEIDYLIVLLHGADEFYVPSPRIQDTCRFMIEMGANAVVVQHPHCLGGYEQYQGGHIVYGQGALVMDEPIYRPLKSFHEGFLVKLSITAGAASTMDIVPFVQSDPVPGARRMEKSKEQEFRRSLEAKSEALKNDTVVEAEWLKFCGKSKYAYISGLLGHNRVMKKLNSHGCLTRLLYGRRQLLGVKNLVCSETHREVIETIFNEGMI